MVEDRRFCHNNFPRHKQMQGHEFDGLREKLRYNKETVVKRTSIEKKNPRNKSSNALFTLKLD